MSNFIINYVVIDWNPETLKWEVLHYDMVLNRMGETIERLRKLYPYCQVMVNSSQIKKEEAKLALVQALEKLKERLNEKV